MRIIKAASLAVILSFLSLSAQAMFVKWDFVGAGASGGSITGSFDYDADSNSFANILAMTSGGSLPTATYSFVSPTFATAELLVFPDMAGPDFLGASTLFIELQGAMTNGGGTLGLRVAITGTCESSNCDRIVDPDFTVDNSPVGSIVSRGVSLSEPGTLSLLIIGLAGIAWVRRRKIA